MQPPRFRLTASLTVIAIFVIAAAWPPAAGTAPDQRATRTPRPGAAATLTAVKPAATSLAATATALKATTVAAATQAARARATLTSVATLPAEEAAAAITAYADSVLDLSVSVTKAGGLTGTVNRALSQTTAGGAAQSATVKLAVKTYGAVLRNGAASLSYGAGTLSGDVTVDVQGSSLGVYSLVVPTSGALTAESALKLAEATFPALAGRAYTAYAVNKGYAWYAQGSTSGLDPKTRKVVALAEAVILYVVPGAGGKASVSATVGRGEFAANIQVP